MQCRTESHAPDGEPYFVGYLKSPPSLARFVAAAAVCCVAAAAAVAALVAPLQRDPGAGAWHADETVTLEGILRLRPYPAIQTAASSGGHTLLLVDQGKRGVARRFSELDGRPVRVRGQLLEREDLRMFELADVADPIQSPHADVVVDDGARPANADALPMVLRGEIVDSKCFCGAMKPGDGKTHKACAALCLKGGIPPVLVGRAADGSSVYHVLTSHSGTALDDAELAKVIAVVGEPVEVTGTVATAGGLSLLKADLNTLRRQ
jgi:hypothetical protein